MSLHSKPEYFLADYRTTCRSRGTMYGPEVVMIPRHPCLKTKISRLLMKALRKLHSADKLVIVNNGSHSRLKATESVGLKKTLNQVLQRSLGLPTNVCY